MIKKYIQMLPLLLLAACAGKQQAPVSKTPVTEELVADSSAIEEIVVNLVCDTALQNPAMRCAAMVDESASSKILTKLDALMSEDMSDLRQNCKQVFYPFSGPDFLYPFTLFKDADSYVMLGLEKTGSPITNEKLSADLAPAYAKALKIYLCSSFFRTLSMKEDLNSEEIDGVVPVITMLMAKSNCQIISVNYPDSLPKCVEIRFFQDRTPSHEQVLYFFSGNVANSGIKGDIETFLNNYLQEDQCVCFLKAASYLMHKSYFSHIRNIVLNKSMAVLQDDSGIPYRYFPEDEWDNTLYGKYIKPLDMFGSICEQPDLDSIYQERDVRKLGFRIGYNNPSNWMCARKRNLSNQ